MLGGVPSNPARVLHEVHLFAPTVEQARQVVSQAAKLAGLPYQPGSQTQLSGAVDVSRSAFGLHVTQPVLVPFEQP